MPLPGERASPTVDTVTEGSAVLPPERSGLPPLYVADRATGSGEVGAVANALALLQRPVRSRPRRRPQPIRRRQSKPKPRPRSGGRQTPSTRDMRGQAPTAWFRPAWLVLLQLGRRHLRARAARANLRRVRPRPIWTWQSPTKNGTPGSRRGLALPGGQFCCGAGQAARPTPAGGGGKASGAARGWKTRTRCSLDGFALARGGWHRSGQGDLRPPCSGYERANCGLCAARRDVNACRRECSNRRPRLANPGP